MFFYLYNTNYFVLLSVQARSVTSLCVVVFLRITISIIHDLIMNISRKLNDLRRSL